MLAHNPFCTSISINMENESACRNIAENISAKIPDENQLVAIVDPCVFPEIDTMLYDNYIEFTLLTTEYPSSDLLPVLPRVFPLGSEVPVTRIIERFGDGVGFMLSCKKSWDISAVTAHLSNLCNTVDPGGKPVWVRFYDPYVMNIILNTSSTSLYSSIFGDNIDMFIVEDVLHEQYNIYCKKEEKEKKYECIQFTPEFIERLDKEHYELFLYNLNKYYFTSVVPYLASAQKDEAKIYIKEHVFAAEQLGFQSMGHLFRFLKMAFRHGWGFYETIPFIKVLQQPFSSAGQKLKALEAVQPEKEL